MTDEDIIAEGRESYHRYGDSPGLNPYAVGRGHEREAQLWHQGFAAARAAKRAAQQPYAPPPSRRTFWPPRVQNINFQE